MPVKLHIITFIINSSTGVIRKSVHRKVSGRHIIQRDSILPDSFS